LDEFHKDVFNFIFSLFEDKVKRDKAVAMMDTIPGFYDELASGLAHAYHQAYPGGLADHTALVCLDGYHSALTKPYIGVDRDDILLAALMHDFDKIGSYTPSIPVIAHDDIQAVNFAEKFGLRNSNIQDGMILVHGGWSKAKVKEHPAIAVYAHAADMFAAHVTKTVKDTRERIRDVMKEIVKLRLAGTKLNGCCPVCRAPVVTEPGTVESFKIYCITCNTRYLVRSGVILAVR
jgi:hypothetical protein